MDASVPRWLLCCLAAVPLGGGPVAAAAAEPDTFYAGKIITIITSGGGAYEAYGRTFARHMPKYIPGHPNIIVQAMPGAGGAGAAGFV
jgi:tripartite-type tricarboxylate transporter receptor subunit TctC